MTAAEAMLAANQPLGPKREKVKEVSPAIGHEPDHFYTSIPFAWPEHVPGSRAAIQESGARKSELVELPRA
jgi:hypothetical protein